MVTYLFKSQLDQSMQVVPLNILEHFKFFSECMCYCTGFLKLFLPHSPSTHQHCWNTVLKKWFLIILIPQVWFNGGRLLYLACLFRDQDWPILPTSSENLILLMSMEPSIKSYCTETEPILYSHMRAAACSREIQAHVNRMSIADYAGTETGQALKMCLILNDAWPQWPWCIHNQSEIVNDGYVLSICNAKCCWLYANKHIQDSAHCKLQTDNQQELFAPKWTGYEQHKQDSEHLFFCCCFLKWKPQ